MKKRTLVGVTIFALLLFVTLGIYLYKTNIGSHSSWELPLSGKIIVLDPGHGGVDGGAVGKDVIEKEVTLAIGLMLRDYLQEMGAYVVMTRETDRDLADEGMKGYSRRKTQDLHNRLDIINAPNTDLFISIHLNAIPSPRWRGAQTFYNPTNKDSRELSLFIQEELRENLENTDRGIKQLSNIFILKEAKTPGAIVEVGFLSNPSEAQLLQQSDYQNQVAASVYRGILRYFTNETAPER